MRTQATRYLVFLYLVKRNPFMIGQLALLGEFLNCRWEKGEAKGVGMSLAKLK